MCECASIRPGNRVVPGRSMVSVPGGACTCAAGPTAAILSPCTSTTQPACACSLRASNTWSALSSSGWSAGLLVGAAPTALPASSRPSRAARTRRGVCRDMDRFPFRMGPGPSLYHRREGSGTFSGIRAGSIDWNGTMCGLAGLLLPSPERQEEELASLAGAMGAAIGHRGPDDHGTWVDARAGVALAHQRLSILDLSPLGHQPMASADGRYVLAYNGEIYNFSELRVQLQALGASFRGHSDTEVLLAAFTAWGVEESLRRCNGMFALAL